MANNGPPFSYLLQMVRLANSMAEGHLQEISRLSSLGTNNSAEIEVEWEKAWSCVRIVLMRLRLLNDRLILMNEHLQAKKMALKSQPSSLTVVNNSAKITFSSSSNTRGRKRKHSNNDGNSDNAKLQRGVGKANICMPGDAKTG